MEVDIRQGKYPGEWKLQVRTESWSEAAREVFSGMERQISDIYSAALGWFAPNACRPDQLLAVLNTSIALVQSRIDVDAPLITEIDPERATGADMKQAMGDFLMAALWFHASALESLSQQKLGVAVRGHGHAVGLHATFRAHLAHIQADAEAPPTGPAHALTFRTDQQVKPEWEAHCRAVAASSRTIDRLDDLLDLSGYEPKFLSIQPRTLKKWAREVGFAFKPGRPKGA